MIETVLRDLKVIDATSMIAGPTASRFFAELGADVIHVEPPRGDDGRNSGSVFLGRESPIFLATNRSKRGIVVDLKRPEGVDALRTLLKDADVFFQNAMPGAMDRMGLGYEDLRALNPRLIYVSISGWGDRGPLAHSPGYDVLIQAYAGAMRRGAPGLPPQFNGSYIGDPTSPILAAFGTMVALRRREQTGTGGHVTTSLLQAAMDNISTRLVLPEGELDAGNGAGGSGVTGGLSVFPCKDDEYVVICAWTDVHFEKLCEIADMQYLLEEETHRTRAGRARDGAAINEIIGHWTSTLPAGALIELLQSENIPCSPVRENGMRGLLDDPQVQENGLAVAIDHPTRGRVWLSAPGVTIDGERGAVRPAPLLGQHTDDVLREHGFSDEQLAGLRERGVVA